MNLKKWKYLCFFLCFSKIFLVFENFGFGPCAKIFYCFAVKVFFSYFFSMSDKAKSNKPKPEEVDEDLATIKVNPLLDHGLGVLFVGLILYLCQHLYEQNQPKLVFFFGVSIVSTIIGIIIVRKVFHILGQIISEARNSESIPKDCRRPLASALAQRKWKDQAWQFAIHVTMSIWEIRIISKHLQWWEDPATIWVNGCQDEAKYDEEFYVFYIAQLSLWILTGISCKWIEARRKDYLQMMTHHVIALNNHDKSYTSLLSFFF